MSGNILKLRYSLHCSHMWPFRRHREKKSSIAKKIIAGIIIGGAIGSIIGKKLLDEENEEGEKEEDK